MNYLEFAFSPTLFPSPLVAGKPFAGLAAGSFTDMYGREVVCAAEKMPAFQRNTQRLIEKFVAKGMPGLPIDARNHDKGEAAGWLVGVEMGKTDDGVPALHFNPRWTELGVGLISGQQVVNFSPTVDMKRQAVVGGSLTNWAATVDADGVPIFRAIELSQSLIPHEVQMEKEELLELLKSERQAMVAELATALGVSSGGTVTDAGKLHELIEKQSNARLEQKLAEFQRGQRLTELSSQLVNGSAEHPFGLPARADELARELQKLPAELANFWQNLLTTIATNGLTDYRELGHGKVLTRKKLLPDYIAADVRAGKLKLSDLSNSIMEPLVGDLGQYDLTEFGGR